MSDGTYRALETELVDPHTFQRLVDEGEVCASCGLQRIDKPIQTHGPCCSQRCLDAHVARLKATEETRAELLAHYGSEEALNAALARCFLGPDPESKP